ncbi:MAG TPA: hypothetical protein VF909_08060, partial [Roseiflexaceae bacterium]
MTCYTDFIAGSASFIIVTIALVIFMLATSSQTIRLSAAERRDPLLLTKLTPPPTRANPIARPRLTDALAHGARGPLTLICAPAGYGKTTLLSAWARQRAAPIAWVSLDRNDNDPLHFWVYVIAALRTIDPDCGADALALIGSPQPPPTTTALTTLLNDLATCASTKVLALDDYHLIDNPAIHQALGFMLEHRPSNLHLILAGRSMPALPLARLRAGGQLVELRAADLRCTRAEATIFLRDSMQLALPPDAVTVLASRTEGWIAGLHLAALAVQGAADVLGVAHALNGTQEMIRDYLIDEVCDQQPAPIQHFLLQTAILERLNAPLCDALLNGSATTKSSDSQSALTYLEQANLFLVPLDEERRWYRYHPLFAEALRARLAQTQPAQVADLHRRAAAWYASEGLDTEAIPHVLAAGDHALAARLVEQVADSMWLRRELSTLAGWLDALPIDLVRTRPALCRMRAWTLLNVGQAIAAEAYLRDAECALGVAPTYPCEETDASAMAAVELPPLLAALRVWAVLSQNGDPQALAQLRAALPVPAHDAQTGNPVTMLHVGFAYWALGERTPARAAFECALTLSRRDANRDGMVLAACFLADLERQAGRLLLATKRYQQLLPEGSGTERHHAPVESYALVGLGRLWYEWNDMETTWRLLQASMEPARRGGNTDALLTSLVTQALVQQARGAPADAQTTMTEALRIARECNVPIWLDRVEALQAQLWLAQGQLPAAVRWARSCGLRGDGPISPQREHEHLVLARIRIAQGAVQTALRLLERIALAAEGDGRTERVIEALILMALAHQARGMA